MCVAHSWLNKDTLKSKKILMKNSILLLLICAGLASCTKQNILPSQSALSSSDAILENTTNQPVVSFIPSVPRTIYLSQGLNTLQTDSFTVSGETAYVTRLVFVVNGTVNLTKFKFYINGGQIKSTITYSNDTIIVALRKSMALSPGNYNYILQSRTSGAPGTSFSMLLNSAIIVDTNKFMVDIRNLPQTGNTMILN